MHRIKRPVLRPQIVAYFVWFASTRRRPLFISVDGGGRLRGSCVPAVRTRPTWRSRVRSCPCLTPVDCRTTEERHSSTLLWHGGARWRLPDFKTSFWRPSMMTMMIVYVGGVPTTPHLTPDPAQTIPILIEPYFSARVVSTCLKEALRTRRRLTCFRDQKVYLHGAMHCYRGMAASR